MRGFRFDTTGPEALPTIPRKPGVYLFQDASETVLYVGKAKDLRQRLASYLRPGAERPRKTEFMLKRAQAFEIIVTATEGEAYILEASLIKEHRPAYNILLRDDKAYPFLRLDIKSDFPRLGIARRRKRDGALYYGPYPSGGAVREALRFLSSLFGLRTCTDANLARGRRERACLQYQIGRCSGPCIGDIDKAAYVERVGQVRQVLEGQVGPLLRDLKQGMRSASKALRFEEAALLRDRIEALEKIAEKQSVVADPQAQWDIVGLARGESLAVAAILRVRDGILRGQEVHQIKGAEGEPSPDVLAAFLRDFYPDSGVPREILLPELPSEPDLLAGWLKGESGRAVLLKASCRGDRARLLAMAEQNARQALLGFEKAGAEWGQMALLLKETLGLQRLPERVEGVDISTTLGEHPIGSLVAFSRGAPDKDRYRRFNIREVPGMDDYAMMRETVRRRASGPPGELPDLFLIDGGRGQLAQAEEALREAGRPGAVELVSLAKEARDEGEKIYRPGSPEPLFLLRHHPVLLFLQRVRDEAHRFGITAHRKKRDRRAIRSQLADIKGVGPAKRALLLKRFGSVARIREASVEDLCGVKGISEALAAEIRKTLASS